MYMSPRPKHSRQLNEPPSVTGFVPKNGDYDPTNRVLVLYEEYESIRLLDYMGLTQLEASKKMDVSRPTLTRIYESARKKVAKAFVENMAISIEGGDVSFKDYWYYCNYCHSAFRSQSLISNEENSCPVCDHSDVSQIQDSGNWPIRGMSYQRSQVGSNNMEGNCICPKCNHSTPHTRGIPCSSKLCPDCNIRMIRENSEHHKGILKKRKNI